MRAIRSMSAKARSLPLSIKMLFVTLVLALALVPLLVGGYVSLENNRQTLLDDKRTDLRANAKEVMASVDRVMKVRLAETVSLARDQVAVSYSQSPESDQFLSDELSGEYRSLMAAGPEIKSMSVLDAATGAVRLSTNNTAGQFLGDRPYFKASVAGETYISPPSRDNGANLIYYSAPIKDASGKPRAVLLMAVDADDVWQELHKELGQTGKGWSVVLTDEYGIRIGNSGGQLLYRSWAPLPEEVRQKLIAEHHYGTDVVDIGSTDVPTVAAALMAPDLPTNVSDFKLVPDGDSYEAGLARSSIQQWSVVEMTPYSSFLAAADSMRKWMAIIIGVTAALIVMLTFFISRMALKPINQLVSSVQNMAEGDLTTPVPEIPDREMRVLAQRFDVLRMRVLDSFGELQQGYIDLAKALVASLEARDPYTAGHTERVAQYSLPLARKLGLSDSEVEIIKRAAELHDIGKVGVPDSVLLKTDRLTPSEAIEIKRHPTKGGEIVRYLGFLREVIPIIEGHHERYDGKGYPHGLRGDDIPLGARILAVADAYDAMTSTRAYRNALNHERAAEILQQGAGNQWDPDVVKAFLEVLYEQHELDDEDWRQRLHASL